MLSKALKPNKVLVNYAMVSASSSQPLQTRAFGSNPGIFHRVFNTLDKSTQAYQTVRHDPTAPLAVSLSNSLTSCEGTLPR